MFGGIGRGFTSPVTKRFWDFDDSIDSLARWSETGTRFLLLTFTVVTLTAIPSHSLNLHQLAGIVHGAFGPLEGRWSCLDVTSSFSCSSAFAPPGSATGKGSTRVRYGTCAF